MMFMTYPDGTREIHDQGLVIRVSQGKVVKGELKLVAGEPPIKIDVEPGDPKGIGYLWQKRTQKKWIEQTQGLEPVLTESGSVWWPAVELAPSEAAS